MKTLRNIVYLTLMLSSLLFISIAWNIDEPFNALKKQISQIDTHPSQQTKKIYLILPNQGCEGCISSVEDFALKNYRNKKLFFIFTRVSSKKLLKIKLTNKVLEQPNFFIDANNIITYPKSDMQIYPMVIYVENNKITSVDYESPATNGIGNLRIYAKKNFGSDDQIL